MNFLLFATSCIACYLFQILFLIKEKKEEFVQTLFLKGLASLVFVILAAFSFLYVEPTFFTIFIFIGLIFDAVADVIFNLRFALKKIEKFSFITGTFLFFTGHIFYLIGLIPVVGNFWIYFAIGLAFTAVVQIFIWLTLKNICAGYKIYGAFYILSVSTMTAMAIGNYITTKTSPAALLFAIGAVFFLISDLLLIFNSFHEKKIYPIRVISFVSYYTGQLIIAMSLFLG